MEGSDPQGQARQEGLQEQAALGNQRKCLPAPGPRTEPRGAFPRKAFIKGAFLRGGFARARPREPSQRTLTRGSFARGASARRPFTRGAFAGESHLQRAPGHPGQVPTPLRPRVQGGGRPRAEMQRGSSGGAAEVPEEQRRVRPQAEISQDCLPEARKPSEPSCARGTGRCCGSARGTGRGRRPSTRRGRRSGRG